VEVLRTPRVRGWPIFAYKNPAADDFSLLPSSTSICKFPYFNFNLIIYLVSCLIS